MRVGPAQLWPEVAPQWILGLPEGLEEFCYDIYKSFIYDNRYQMYVEGLGNTLLITLGALAIGVIIGTVIAITKYYCEGNKKLRFLSWLCDLYTTVIRGIPITVLLMLFFFVIFVSARDGVPVAIAAFGIGKKTTKRLRLNILSMSNVDIIAKRRYFEPKKGIHDMVFLNEWGSTY